MLTMLPIWVVAFAFGSHSYEIGPPSSAPSWSRSPRSASFWRGWSGSSRDWEKSHGLNWRQAGRPTNAALPTREHHRQYHKWML
jgi:hypothetical protein